MCWLRGLRAPPPARSGGPGADCRARMKRGRRLRVPSRPSRFRQYSQVFAGTEASMPTPACLTGRQAAPMDPSEIVSANFFESARGPPDRGPTFLPDEDRKLGGKSRARDQPSACGVGDSARTRRSVGSVADLRRSFTVVGVAPAAFHGSVDLIGDHAWVLLSMIWEVRNQGTFFCRPAARADGLISHGDLAAHPLDRIGHETRHKTRSLQPLMTAHRGEFGCFRGVVPDRRS